ncbi:hypothetical protein BDW66DRAFT_147601 [Aspergillus desertorum]
MAKGSLLSPIPGLDSPVRPQAHGNDFDGDQGTHARPSGRRVFEVFDNQNSASAKSKQPLSEKASPYTDEFFANVAEAIVRTFPFTEFAKENGCEIKDVVRALKTSVVEPLSKRSIQKSSTPTGFARSKSATLTPTPSSPPPAESSQSSCRLVSRQPWQPTASFASSSRTGFSTSTCRTGKRHEGEAAKCVQSGVEFVSSTAATSKPFKLLEGGRGMKRRKTMAPAERQVVNQDVYGTYVPVESQSTPSGRIGDNGSKRR